MKDKLNWSFLSMLLVGLFLLPLASCKDNVDKYEAPKVEFTPQYPSNTISFDQDGGSIDLTMTTNRKWTVDKDADWITVTPIEGLEGQVEISVTVERNTGIAREGGFRVVASGKSFFYTVLQKSSTGQEFVYTPLSAIQEMGQSADQSGKLITEDINIQATVVTNSDGKNFTFAAFHYIMDKDNNGLVLTLPKGEAPLKYGDKVTVNINGCKVSNYNATVQLEVPTAKMKIESNQPVTPLKATISDILAGKYENVLVLVENVQFPKYEGEKMYSSDNDFFMKSHPLSDQAGNLIDVEVLKNSAFKDELVPAGSGSIIAVVALYQKAGTSTPLKYALKPSLYSDMQMKGPRF